MKPRCPEEVRFNESFYRCDRSEGNHEVHMVRILGKINDTEKAATVEIVWHTR